LTWILKATRIRDQKWIFPSSKNEPLAWHCAATTESVSFIGRHHHRDFDG